MKSTNPEKGAGPVAGGAGAGPVVREGRPRKRMVTGADWVPWVVARNLAIVFMVVGAVDLTLLWYPPRFGSPEFEFATISRFSDGMPVFAMGLGLLALTGIGGERRGAIWAAFGFSVLVALLLTLLGIVFLTDVPIALRSVQDPVVQVGVRKVIVKTLLQFAVYWFLLVYLAMRTFRSVRGLG